jgi:hypothetical protein
MIQRFILIALILVGLLSCNTTKQTSNKDIKIEHIRKVIQVSGFVKLPLIFDASIDNSLKSNYSVDFESNDTLIFDRDIYDIIGFLPDTSDYYGILFHTIGDMLYPTILTIDKKGNKIDRKIIYVTLCAGQAAMDVASCYDSVWIYSDLKIESISKVIGTIETEDSIPQTLNICNIRTLKGLIDRNGRISLKSSDIIDCNE